MIQVLFEKFDADGPILTLCYLVLGVILIFVGGLINIILWPFVALAWYIHKTR